jgi:hypothetical protein
MDHKQKLNRGRVNLACRSNVQKDAAVREHILRRK